MKSLSIAAQPARPGGAWLVPGLVTAGLILLVLFVFRETAAAMVSIWDRSGDFTHAYVVPPLSLWLIWRMRSELALLTPRPAPLMLVVIALLALVWWLGDQVAINSVTQLALMGMVVAMVPLILGWQAAWAMVFPLAFLVFAVPIGDFMTPYLMEWTAQAAVAGLRMTGIPVFREGQLLIIPSGQWKVVEACGGIRYLMSTLMAGSLFAYLNYRTTKRRLAFMALAFVVPIAANWARAYMIIMIGHLSDNTLAVGVDHLLYGWVFFGIVVFALFAFGARWTEPEPSAAPAAPAAPATGASTAQPVWWPLVVALGAAAALQLPVALMARDADTAARGAPALALPATAGEWRQMASPTLDWTPYYRGATVELNQAYVSPQGEVVVNLQYFRDQRYEAKLVSSDNELVSSGDKHWQLNAHGQRLSSGPHALRWNTGHVAQTNYLGILGAQRRHLQVWQIYWIGGHMTHSQVVAKLWQGWLALSRQPDDAASIILHAPGSDAAAAQARLQSFTDTQLPMILESLERARATP